jgi:hypothetical protein
VILLLREESLEWCVMTNPIPFGKCYRDIESGLSCTPDAFVIDRDRDLSDFAAAGVCNIKTVNEHVFKTEWMIDGDVHLPPYVAIQVMQEMFLTGASWGCIFAIIGFDLDTHLIDVKPHPGIVARIKREVPDFLRRVRENDPPPPDYARDGATIAAIYDEDDGGTVDFATRLEIEPYNRVLTLLDRRGLCKDFEATGAEAAKQRKVIDAELIHMLGNAARGTLADGRAIEAKTVRRKGFTVDPTSFRSLKIKQAAV